MTFQESVQTCFIKYVDFSGVASRSEYWWFVLFLIVTSTLLYRISYPVYALFALGTLLPSLAAASRRLHHTGRSGWWQLIWFLPVIGWIILIVLLAQEGRVDADI